MKIDPRRSEKSLPTPSRAEAALMRGFLISFLPWVFSILHKGAKPLKLEWYLMAMCEAFQRTAVGQCRRLVINVPPRHLKSITATAYVAWMLGRCPDLKIMIATYGDKLGREHLERLKTIMSHPYYKRVFPKARLLVGGIGRLELRTTEDGGCRVVTVNGAATGFGADIILIDDAMKADDHVSEVKRAELDRFYRQTLLTRLNSKSRGIVISIQQRLGGGDLPERLIDAGAEHLSLPSYDDQERTYAIGFGRRYRRPAGEVLRPDDEPMEVLKDLERHIGKQDFATQYLQQPGAIGGNIIPLTSIPRFELTDKLSRLCYPIVQSWDTAVSEHSGAAFSVCITFGYYRGRWHVLHVRRERLGYAKLRDAFLAQHELWQPRYVLLEDQSSGRPLYDDLRYRSEIRPIMIRPVQDKETRMIGQLALIEDGFLALPREAPWLDVLVNELRLFPVSEYMDQIDALSQFLDWAKRRDKSIRAPRDPETGRKCFVERKQSINRRHSVTRR